MTDAYGHSDTLLTDEQRAIREVVREFAVEEVRPGAREADAEEAFPEDTWDGLADLDLTGLTVPEEYGGFDADRATYALVNEELAYGQLAVATALSVHCLATSCIAEFGTEAVREEWLPEMVDGRPVGAFCLSEPHAGSNPAEMSTTAVRDGDVYVLNGDKQWITNGERAGVYVVFAKTDPDDDGSITQFLVPADYDGVTVGRKEDKLGLRASDTTAMQFDDVRLPEKYRLTEEGKGLSAAFRILTGGRIAIAAQAVGLAQAAIDESVEYAWEREQFDGPIAEIQSVRHKFSEMATNTQAARLLVREAARQSDAGDDPRLLASMAKYFASETAVDVTNEAVQIHGGYGYMTEFDVERFYRDAKITTIYEGTSEIQKKIIARDVLG
ncbi:acyl-CoA dehydrogenase family protein [Halorarum halophilum]|uniref:Acyl-CoA dehydrogenase family protein n=1 Tax=Halorarum halophilum TaxID=2743090 RepID=A0A7D5L2L5_9EURY|nr:acyl-CoA dehydrogenase family protein [Halobaculum halophilum]QLG26623.1 acyl-CoA dehydrogenase family protein [Halobaculum halophilum]